MGSPAAFHAAPARPTPPKSSALRNTLSLPAQWVGMYDDFITKNAHQVGQIESTLRSLTYIIPGRFRDAEIASESIHSGVQLLSLYHDALLRKAHALSKIPPPPPPPPLAHPPTPHGRYTRFWTAKSALYRRAAYALQVVQYVELLCEMAAKRRGETVRWRVVVLLEALKAVCRLILLRVTRSRPLVAPALPERGALPEEPAPTPEEEGEVGEDDEDRGSAVGFGNNGEAAPPRFGPNGEWTMSRTGMTLPSLPAPGDTSGYLLSRVLTAEDIKPAAKLLNRLQGQGQAAEVLHILAPLVFAVALARSKDKRKAWAPWLLGVGVELAARQLRDRGLRTTPLEREEWARRGWAMGWWAMRGAFYENVTKGLVTGVRRRMPGLLAGILEDYEYLWENYHFSTSS
ncbi:peroxisomal membrane protein PEX16 [Staphylotrichum tortipilum]|uniref:Peroxisomal membrane protein PEX16 n=1 Tax=Staphylotrichum tortipilum TaxID=2831512 RepID=A0AAN6MDC8_9PEZI|nr:peroxisomal membrane protein PEX16 [Staphylotrichum longicolle]